MGGRALWGVAVGIVASGALALLFEAPRESPPPSTPSTAAPAEPDAPAAAKDAAPAAKKRSGLEALEADVLERVNRHRRAAGLRALRADARLAEIARAHSRAMAAGRRRFGHGDFDERTQAVEARVVRYRRVAENVARNGSRRGDVPARAVAGWLRSSGHRRNIDGPYSLTGVGAATSGRGEVYLTQIFVAPR